MSPRINARLSISNHLTVFAGYGLYGQAPSQLWLAADRNNRNLPYFKDVQTTAGFTYEPTIPVRARVDAYYKNYLDYPVSAIDSIRTLVGWGTDYQFYDPRWISADGRGYSRGVESYIEIDPHKNTSVVLSGSLSRCRFRGVSAREIPSDFDVLYTYSLAAYWSPLACLDLTTSFVGEGGKPYTPIDPLRSRWYNDTVYQRDKQNSERFRPYQRIDVGLSIHWRIGGATGTNYITVINLLDRKNPYFHYWHQSRHEIRTYYQWERLVVTGFALSF
jgi:hypothetical protein